MPDFSQINSFYIFLAFVFIPWMIGFLTEAGKDAYNALRKKRAPGETCAECEHVKTDITSMKSKQSEMREVRLPRIESKLEQLSGEIGSLSDSMDQKFEATNKNIQRLFEIWDATRFRGSSA